MNIYRIYNRSAKLLVSLGVDKIVGVKGKNLYYFFDSRVRKWMNSRNSSSIQIDGLSLSYPCEGYFGLEIASGKYEPRTKDVFEQLIYPGMTVVDIGAHVGYYTLVAAKALHNQGLVYAFEPDPVTKNYLQKNVSLNNFEAMVELNLKAVSDFSGIVDLYFGKRDRVANSLFVTPGVSADRSTCEAITLDDFFGQKAWPKIDLIKMDVEGAEHAVLKGMKNLSLLNPELKIITEFFPENLQAADVRIDEFFNTLFELGFFYVYPILDKLKPIILPDDIPGLLELAGPVFVNLLCTKTNLIF